MTAMTEAFDKAKEKHLSEVDQLKYHQEAIVQLLQQEVMVWKPELQN